MTINALRIGEKLKKELSQVIASKKLPHTIIIDSGDGDSRLELAVFLSACFVCGDDNNIPCGECRDCRKAFGRIHPDIEFYQRESGKKEFSVKIVKDVINPSVYIKPGEADCKVVIIKDAESMNVNAQNALLKIAEEPPANVKFILCCDFASSMLETIRSRSTVYSVNGNTGADSEREKTAKEIAEKLVNCLMLPTEFDFIAETSAFEKDRELFSMTVCYMQMLFRNAVFLKNNVEADNEKLVSDISSFFGMNELIRIIEKLNDLYESSNKNSNLNLLITRLSSCLRQEARG